MRMRGFTLAELLIALVILGLIATFTIPKVLNSQANSQNIAVTKEIVSAISGAYQAYQQSNTPQASTGMSDLTPYLNYVKRDSTSTVDGDNVVPTADCSTVGFYCYRMHNGAIFGFDTRTFGSTAVTSALVYGIDPDGKQNGGYQQGFAMFLNGRVTTIQTCETQPMGCCTSTGCGSSGHIDSTWFNWN